MRRVIIVVTTCVLLVWVVARRTYEQADAAVREVGRTMYPYRQILLDRLDDAPSSSNEIAWLGDSTLLPGTDYGGYVGEAGRVALDGAPATHLVVAAAGLDPFAYWALAGRVAASRPRMVVVVANFRLMNPAGGVSRFTDLVGEIDWADVPAALTLPYSVRGLTAPRLLLARLLTTPEGSDLFLVSEAERRNAHDAEVWDRLGPPEPTGLQGPPGARLRHALAEYDRPLGPRQAAVRYLAAAVERLARDGTPVLVVVTPVPWEYLSQLGFYEQRRFDARVDVLRRAVEAAGGDLVDLHRALPNDQFVDLVSHFNRAGMTHMARLVGTAMRPLLERRREPKT